jgi:hypothetical protein
LDESSGRLTATNAVGITNVKEIPTDEIGMTSLLGFKLIDASNLKYPDLHGRGDGMADFVDYLAVH